MKMQADLYNILKTGLTAVVNHYGIEKIKESYKNLSQTRMVWDMFWQANTDLRYDDSHPQFKPWTDNNTGKAMKARTRLTPYVEGYDTKLNELNNDHINTAITKICKELGLI